MVMKAERICGEDTTGAPMQNSSKEPKQRVCNRTPPTLGLCTTGRLLVLLINSLLDAWGSLPKSTTTSTSLSLWQHQVPLYLPALLQETQHRPTQMLHARAAMTFSLSLACIVLTFKPHWWTSMGTTFCAYCRWVLLQIRT
jgi:hypothetical protein